MFTKTDLGRLVAVDAAPAVSVFLPTHVAGRETRQGAIRLKNLLGAAVQRLVERGVRRPDAEMLIAPAARLLDDAAFWRHQDEGLALFLARDVFEAHRVPLGLPEEVVVSEALAVRPLLPLLAADGSFMILTVTAAGARLFAATRHGVSEEGIDLPAGTAAVDAETDYDKNTLHSQGPVRSGDRRSTGANAVKTHNFGDSPEELRRAHLLEYLRRLGGAVERHLERSGFRGPLVLVGDPEIQGQLRKAMSVAALLEGGIEANPAALDIEEIHRRAYRLVEPLFDRDRQDAVDRFRAVAADTEQRGRAVTRPEEVVRAGVEGRVATLLLAKEGSRLWGRFDAASGRVTAASNEPDGAAVDLLETATANTLLHGGTVHVVAKADLPPEATVAAILRY